ncbi:twin-arginine translocase TatA/TatE family subunit [uncultured Friedmanniella sp.]|uniref:twin-arginine translocase TatA/TatE family subunit n=1 Tax=uncultured Friedmanniella sp. TaxID=335381 RepID=UPI0035CBD227
MFPLAMFGLGVPELLIILAVVLLLFGGSRLAGLGKSTGRALKEFKEETKGLKAGETPPAPGVVGQSPYQTEAGSTFVPSPQANPYPQPEPGVTYNQPPQQGEVHYDAPPQNGQPTNGAPYGQPSQAQPTERDARRDV